MVTVSTIGSISACSNMPAKDGVVAPNTSADVTLTNFIIVRLHVWLWGIPRPMKQPLTTRIPQLNASLVSPFNEIIATLWFQQTPAQKPGIAPWLSADR
jgi:hypothetical protein